jgi:hypothetical protein
VGACFGGLCFSARPPARPKRLGWGGGGALAHRCPRCGGAPTNNHASVGFHTPRADIGQCLAGMRGRRRCAALCGSAKAGLGGPAGRARLALGSSRPDFGLSAGPPRAPETARPSGFLCGWRAAAPIIALTHVLHTGAGGGLSGRQVSGARTFSGALPAGAAGAKLTRAGGRKSLLLFAARARALRPPPGPVPRAPPTLFGKALWCCQKGRGARPAAPPARCEGCLPVAKKSKKAFPSAPRLVIVNRQRAGRAAL